MATFMASLRDEGLSREATSEHYLRKKSELQRPAGKPGWKACPTWLFEGAKPFPLILSPALVEKSSTTIHCL
jgi:hypothetical protein